MEALAPRLPCRAAAALLLVLAGCGANEGGTQPSLAAGGQVRTYGSGDMLYLERRDGATTTRIGLDRRWGGAIAEVSLNGVNMVNAYDPGREVQLSLYDGDEPGGDLCGGCEGKWPWNPVHAGDRHGHGSEVLLAQAGDSSLYVVTRPLHWLPEGRGGAPGTPGPSDMLYAMRVSVVPGSPGAFHVQYRATHMGRDTHGAAAQEVPAVYVNRGFDT
ncbi:MAG TPA: hypothetical protein VF665_05195, partial [Longimicrobium sp.]